MPHVIVHFDPSKIEQEDIDNLKKVLPEIVANSLSYRKESAPATWIRPSEVYVRQESAHKTDQNVPPIEVEVQAGSLLDRNEIEVGTRIAKGIANSGTLQKHVISVGNCSAWLRFSAENDFRFITPEPIK